MVKKVWVPKKQQVVVNQAPTNVTPSATPVNQAMPMTHFGADGGWRVATKRTKHKGVPVSTRNTFCTLVEDDTNEDSMDDDVGADTGDDLATILPPESLC